MRPLFDKKHYTKAERVFVRLLQELQVPFKAKVIIANREVDFLIKNFVIEINGHDQDGHKNFDLIELGLTPIHFSNKELTSNRELIKDKLIKLLCP
jgi:very-short-patch-repair endonuclease